MTLNKNPILYWIIYIIIISRFYPIAGTAWQKSLERVYVRANKSNQGKGKNPIHA